MNHKSPIIRIIAFLSVLMITSMLVMMIPATVNAQAVYCISGYKINNDTGAGIEGWIIRLYNDDGVLIFMTITNGQGWYSFCNLPAGEYLICEETRAGWYTVGEACIAVVLVASDATDVDFYNGSGTGPGPEVGGEVYPANKVALFTLVVALAVVILSSAGILVWRRRTQRQHS